MDGQFVFQKINKIKVDKFIWSLFLAIVVASIFPKGAEILQLKQLTGIGIGLIFFFYGLKLSLLEVVSGLKNYKLHVLIQLSTFLIFPLIVLLSKPLLVSLVGESFWIGLFFLSVLPSTVSSSVVMVSLAKGNVPSAIFNASISGLLGVFLTPLWIGFIVQQSQEMSLVDVFVKLIIQILLPLALGLLLNGKLGSYAKKHSAKISIYDKSIIVLIVYISFCTSFAVNMFSGISWLNLFFLFAVIFFLFWLLMGIIYLLTKQLKFSISDRITAMFCGSKKSLVHGSAMINIVFVGSVSTSLYLLPVMLYHITQLVLLAIIANRLGKREV